MLTEQEFETLMTEFFKEKGFAFPMYDSYGNVRLESKDILIVMNADFFNNIIKDNENNTNNPLLK